MSNAQGDEVKAVRVNPQEAKQRLTQVLYGTSGEKLLQALKQTKPTLSHAEASKYIQSIAHTAVIDGLEALSMKDISTLTGDPYLLAALFEHTKGMAVRNDSPWVKIAVQWDAQWNQLSEDERKKKIQEDMQTSREIRTLLKAWESGNPEQSS